jgi:hypothetical protein
MVVIEETDMAIAVDMEIAAVIAVQFAAEQ